MWSENRLQVQAMTHKCKTDGIELAIRDGYELAFVVCELCFA